MTLDKILKNIRLSKNLTVKELSDRILISIDNIRILESSDFLSLLSSKNINIFLKKYSKFFDLDFGKLKKYIFVVDNDSNSVFYKKVFIKKLNQNFSFFGFMKVFTVFAVFILLFFYIGVEVKNRYNKPELFVYSPFDNYNTENKDIAIKGKTVKNTNVNINGDFVLIDQFGNFSKDILLNEGLNVIRITAAKDNGEENVVVKRIILEKNKLTINK